MVIYAPARRAGEKRRLRRIAPVFWPNKLNAPECNEALLRLITEFLGEALARLWLWQGWLKHQPWVGVVHFLDFLRRIRMASEIFSAGPSDPYTTSSLPTVSNVT